MTPLGDWVKIMVKMTPLWELGFCWSSSDEDMYQVSSVYLKYFVSNGLKHRKLT